MLIRDLLNARSAHSLSIALGACLAVGPLCEAQNTFELLDVPDFDQIRAGLGGTGNCHCVPATTCDWTAFLAQRGFSDLQPGVYPDWQDTRTDSALDMVITDTLGNFGVLMSTVWPGTSTTGCGTNNTNFETGLQSIIGDYEDDLNYTIVRAREDFTPRASELVRKVASNSVVIQIIGWYRETTVPTFDGRGLPILERNGGHAVALNGWNVSGFCGDFSLDSVQFRDPGDSFGSSTQSLFSSISSGIEPFSAFIRWTGNSFYERTHDRLVDYGGRFALIDGFYSLDPAFALSVPDADPDEVFQVRPAIVMSEFIADPVSAIASQPGEEVIDLAIDPLNSNVYVLQNGFAGDILARTCRAEEFYEAMELFEEAKHLAFARNLDLLVAADGDLIRTRVVDQSEAQEINRVTPPAPIDALGYDNALDRILTLHIGANLILSWAPDLSGVPLELPMPAGIELVGPVALAVSPATGDYMVLDAEFGRIYPLINTGESLATEGLIEDANLRNARKVHVAPSGNVWSTAGGQILEFAQDGFADRGAGWQQVSQSVFQGYEFGALTVFSANHSNIDHVVESTPPYTENVLPDEFPGFKTDCPPDANGDGVVNFGDITEILGLWLTDYTPEALTGPGDANDDGLVNFNDVTSVLANWLMECP